MKRMLVLLAATSVALTLLAPATSSASNADLVSDARRALDSLTSSNKAARDLRAKSKAVLVFPRMIKAGFLFGGQIGDGVLFRGKQVDGFYNSVAASYGLQVGGQTFGYALFFVNEAALSYLNSSAGWEIGTGPSVVVIDQGMAKSFSSTTLTQDVYAFIFNQKGLMAGVGIQGSKITRTDD